MSESPPAKVAILGLPSDVNSSFVRGAALAPPLLRQALFSPSSNSFTEGLLDVSAPGVLRDGGDVSLAEDPSDVARIAEAISRVLDAGERPLSFGGDHSVTYPILRAIAAKHGPVSVLHFDAHPDLYDVFEGNRLSHACPFARILEEGLARQLVSVGIRTLNHHQAEQARRFGVTIVDMDAFSPDTVPIPDGPLYITIDLDGLDPAFAPGVAHPEGGGLSTRELVRVLHRVAGPVVGADIVEYLPRADVGGRTAAAAAKLAKELVGLLAR